MAGEGLGVRISADTSGVERGLAAVATAARRSAQEMTDAQKLAASAMRETARQAAAAANSGSYQKIAEGAEKVRASHAGVNRELLVLAHELSQGNYKQFGGSMLVLAERTNALEFAMTGAGAATLGVVGVGIAFVAMAARGAIEADKFAKSMQLTGNYAALTEDSLTSLARAQAATTGQTFRGARESLETAAGSGLFGPQAVASVSRAMGDYERLTGASAEEALKNFDRIKDGVAKWAEEQNRQIHFLTLADYERIKTLEQSGHAEEAAIETLNNLAQALESRGTPAVGNFAAAWGFVKESVLAAVDAMDQAGRPTTIGDHIADVQRQLLWNQNGNAGGAYSDRQRETARLQAELSELMKQQFRDTERLADASVRAADAQSKMVSRDYIDKLHEELSTRSRLTEKLDEYKRHADALNLSPAQRAEDVAALTKRYTPHVETGGTNEYASLLASIKAFNAQTDEEASRMGKLTDAQRFSIQMHETLEKSGRKLTAAQRASVTTLIGQAAAYKTVTDAQVAAQAAAIARVQADTANQQAQQALLDGVVGSGNDQANSIFRQMATIGKSAEEISKFTALAQFDDMVGKALLGADGDTVKRINEVVTVLRGNLVSAIDAATAAQHAYNASFSNGWDKAMTDYIRNAQDSAKAGEQVFNDAMSGMTDAIVQFAQTGKLSFSSLVQSITADLVRLAVQKGAGALFGGSGGLLSGVLSLFGGGSGVPAADYSSAGLRSAFGYANGLDYVPYDGFPAILHEGERVLSKQVARGSDGGVHIDMSGAVYSFGAGVSASEVAQAIASSNAALEQRLHRQLRTGRVVA